ncbi:hypothetical protein [Streptomyces nanshensis]|uniref:Uncharacterized protein n=1 Tax=Streptomyces nanshensis TaxID=518642 RepID=A0A1E7LAH3_9ACTN|nr:hypothetical protein [Streptomyces nanshensis]OEV12983.1 hypothetical protein AN218_05590 [Streptomyces nanshensis]
MTDAAQTPGTERPDPSPLSPRDESRLRYSGRCLRLIDTLLQQVPIDPDAEPGSLLAAALRAEEDVAWLVKYAVVAERERDTPYPVLGRVAGISKQSAHRRWADDVAAWAHNGRTCMTSDSFDTPLQRAHLYDELYARLRPDAPAEAVSSGLDAVRIPGSENLDRARRERADAVHQRRDALARRSRELGAEAKQLGEEEGDSAERVAALRAAAAADEELAELYEQLIPLEPELAEEHRAYAAKYRGFAQAERDHADLVAERTAAAEWVKAKEAPAVTNSEEAGR